MLRVHGDHPEALERRYDSSVLRKVVDLATRLKSQREETLTGRQIEAIGAELDLEPELIRQALARVVAEHPQPPRRSREQSQLRSLAAAFMLPVLWGLLAFVWRGDTALLLLFSLIGLLPAAGFLGFLTGKKDLAALFATELVLALAPATFPFCFIHVPLAWPFARWAALRGADLRQEHCPGSLGDRSVSRHDLLQQLFEIQGHLETQKLRRAFLSVDVVGSTAMTMSAPELEVEFSFGEFRRWAQDIISHHGGELQSAAGDGVMCSFEDDAAAVRAACELQTGLPEFNASRNRLPQPFQIRCGISAGEVAIEKGAGLRDVQSPAIYRAAMMQKRAEPGDIVVSTEVAGSAILELNALAPLTDTTSEEPSAFSWRAGQRMLGTGG